MKEHEERASEVVIVFSVFELGDIGGLEQPGFACKGGRVLCWRGALVF